MTLMEAEAARRFDLQFHWVLRGAGQSKNPGRLARKELRRAQSLRWSSVEARFLGDTWYRTEKEAKGWTVDTAREQDRLAAEEPDYAPMTRRERMEANLWKQTRVREWWEGPGGGSNTQRRPWGSWWSQDYPGSSSQSNNWWSRG